MSNLIDAQPEEYVQTLLTRRINAVGEPGRLINQLHAAQARCAATGKGLKRLIARAPRISRMVRMALQDAFALNPDHLLFTEPGQVNSLTERALALLVDPFIPANINQFTQLSVKDDSARKLPYTPFQVLEKVKALGLLERFHQGVAAYWSRLAYGSWLTRRERWVQLYAAQFADQAFIACQLYELSEPAFAMVRQLADAPTPQARRLAGGEWTGMQVRQLFWPGTNQAALAVPGALYVSRGSLHVAYLPGLARGFYEYQSWTQMQQGVGALLQGRLFTLLWQCLALRRRDAVLEQGPIVHDDALAHSALALLDGQWHNELACALTINHRAVAASGQAPPQPRRFLVQIEKARKHLVGEPRLVPSMAALLKWDGQRQAAQVMLGRFSPGLSLAAREHRVRRHEKGLFALLDSQDLAKDTEPYLAFVALQARWQVQRERVRQWAEVAPERAFDPAFWLERPDGTRKRATLMLEARRQALLAEAELLRRAQLISAAHQQCLVDVLETPLAGQRTDSDACVLRIRVGREADRGVPLHDVFVVTTRKGHSRPTRQQPVLLVVGGAHGGMSAFNCLADLSHSLQASLQSPDRSPLWCSVARDQRALRAAGVEVTYAPVTGNVLHEGFNGLVKLYARLAAQLDDKVRLYSEVSDPALARLLLADELREHVQVPVDDARMLALANVQLLRVAATQAKKLPAWLGTATATLRQRYRHLQNHYLTSAVAFEEKLWSLLPELEDFARERLIAQLTLDGFYPQLDVDRPLFDIPDDVSAHFCGLSSQCAVGDRHVKKVVSVQRSTYSLLQLALHNLDPQAPWTEWRLNRARYLDPAWKDRLSVRYLIKTLSALDIGGHYEARIRQVFYPESDNPGLCPALSYRVVRQHARWQLFSAEQQGLSPQGRSLFNTAIAARVPDDLTRNGHCVQLCFVRLVGYTLEHDRHIAGMLVLFDRVSQRCVVYWPAAQGFPVISEYPDWDAMRDSLNRDCALPAPIKVLARQVAPGWAHEALASYPGAPPSTESARGTFRRLRMKGFFILTIGEAVARFVRSFKVQHRVASVLPEEIEAQIREQIQAVAPRWLDIAVTDHSHAVALLVHARLFEIQHRSQASARSAQALAEYRERRLGEQRSALVRGVLSFIPLIGVGISVYELLLAARHYHHSGDPKVAVDVAFLTLIAFVDVLTALVPGPKGLSSAGSATARATMRNAMVRFSQRPALTGLKRSMPRPLKLLERYRKDGLPSDALRLHGPGNRGSYITDGEQFVVIDSERYPVYRRKDEQVLRFRNQQADGQDELILYIDEPREWLLGADAPQPQPGPSAAPWRPWASSSAATEWARPAQALLEQVIRQSPEAPGGWQAWGFVTEMTLVEATPPRNIFTVSSATPDQAFSVLRLGTRYYRLLPEAQEGVSQRLVFITPNHAVVHPASIDVYYWTGPGIAHQPIPATLGANGVWTLHQGLFTEPVSASLNRAFPLMTRGSRHFLLERLLHLSDSSRSTLTATQWFDLRATLDKWLAPSAVGQTDDLLRLLRPIESSTRTSIFIGDEGLTPGFDRLDFHLPQAPEASLQVATQHNLSERRHLAQGQVRGHLEQMGFSLHRVEKRPGALLASDFYCTHPQSDTVYFVMTRWSSGSSLDLKARVGIQMTDEWFRQRFFTTPIAAAHAPIAAAMREGRLVKIIAGVQWTPRRDPSVYFVRFGNVMPGARQQRPRYQKKRH